MHEPNASTGSLARLRPDIEQRGLTGFHHGDRFSERRPELRRILDRPLRPPAHRLRKLVVLNVRVLDAGADWPQVVTEIGHAIAEVGQALEVHDLLVIAAVVEHYGQLRNVVPCGGPQHTRRVHEIAVGLDVDREAAEIAVGERGTDRGGGAVPYAISS